MCVVCWKLRRPTRSTPLYSSAASNVYKGQTQHCCKKAITKDDPSRIWPASGSNSKPSRSAKRSKITFHGSLRQRPSNLPAGYRADRSGLERSTVRKAAITSNHQHASRTPPEQSRAARGDAKPAGAQQVLGAMGEGAWGFRIGDWGLGIGDCLLA